MTHHEQQIIFRRQLARDYCETFRRGDSDCASCPNFNLNDYLPEENQYEPACPAHPTYWGR